MVIGVKHIVSFLLAVAVLIGGAFALGSRLNAKTGTTAETAAAVSALDPSDASSTEETSAPTSASLYKVLRIVDGDTIAVEIDGKSESVRMIGIDTPEINDSRTGVQCFGKEASEETKSLLTGAKVRLEKDDSQGERDKYKRLLAYVFREDGVFITKKLVADGYAHEYTYDLPYKYQVQFKAAETAAREGEKGLWSPAACPTPPPERNGKSASTKTTSNTNANQAAAAAAAAAPVSQPVQQLVQPPVQQPQPAPMPQKQPDPEPTQPPKQEPPPATSSSFDVSAYTCSANTYNCSDFKTQQQAQAVYDKCGGVANDVHKLDKNKDGHPCDSLP